MGAIKDKDKKTEVLNLRITPDLHKALKQAAKARNQSKTEFVMHYLMEAVQKELQGGYYQYLEERDGVLLFKGRRLEVFQNYLFFTQSGMSAQEWADTYNLPVAAVDEARHACEGGYRDAYLSWKAAYQRDDEEGLVVKP